VLLLTVLLTLAVETGADFGDGFGLTMPGADVEGPALLPTLGDETNTDAELEDRCFRRFEINDDERRLLLSA